jgi:hypothetical protein
MIHEVNRSGSQAFANLAYVGPKTCDFSIKMPIVPPASLAAPNAPQMTHFLEAAFGTVTQTTGESIVYAPGDVGLPKLFSIALTHNYEDQIQGIFMWNAFIKTCKVTLSGGSVPMLEFTGSAADVGYAAKAEIAALTATSIQLAGSDVYTISPGAFVALDGVAQTSGLGWKIATQGADGQVLTVEAGSESPAAAGVVGGNVGPYLGPAATWPASALGPFGHSFTLDGVFCAIESAEFEIDTNPDVADNIAGADGVVGAYMTTKMWKGSFNVRAHSDIISRAMQRASAHDVPRTANVVLALGSTTPGKNWVFSAPQFAMDYAYPSASEGVSTFSLAGHCLDSDEGANDALTLTIT